MAEADIYPGEAWAELPQHALTVLADVQVVSVDQYDGVITVLIGDAMPPATSDRLPSANALTADAQNVAV